MGALHEWTKRRMLLEIVISKRGDIAKVYKKLGSPWILYPGREFRYDCRNKNNPILSTMTSYLRPDSAHRLTCTVIRKKHDHREYCEGKQGPSWWFDMPSGATSPHSLALPGG